MVCSLKFVHQTRTCEHGSVQNSQRIPGSFTKTYYLKEAFTILMWTQEKRLFQRIAELIEFPNLKTNVSVLKSYGKLNVSGCSGN